MKDSRKFFFLGRMDIIAALPEQRDRMASIIGAVEALMGDDPELVEAIEKAFKGPQKAIREKEGRG